jgi:hypothetical protein
MFVITKVQLFDNITLDDNNTTAASRRTHQVTTILDKLLKNYDAHIRPNFGGRKTKLKIFVLFLLIISLKYSEGPTKINFDILVSSFGPIQDIDMVCI